MGQYPSDVPPARAHAAEVGKEVLYLQLPDTVVTDSFAARPPRPCRVFASSQACPPNVHLGQRGLPARHGVGTVFGWE